MATKRKLQIRYGAAASRPTLATGELGLDTDTGAESLYIGTPAGNKAVATLGVKKYVAILTQSDTSAPVATVLENTLGGTVVWTRVTDGSYLGTLANAFPFASTVFYKGVIDLGGDLNAQLAISDSDDDIITLATNDSGIGSDSVITGLPVVILVYP